jgi:hypothetical protein
MMHDSPVQTSALIKVTSVCRQSSKSCTMSLWPIFLYVSGSVFHPYSSSLHNFSRKKKLSLEMLEMRYYSAFLWFQRSINSHRVTSGVNCELNPNVSGTRCVSIIRVLPVVSNVAAGRPTRFYYLYVLNYCT